jgi:hypothetical protein
MDDVDDPMINTVCHPNRHCLEWEGGRWRCAYCDATTRPAAARSPARSQRPGAPGSLSELPAARAA